MDHLSWIPIFLFFFGCPLFVAGRYVWGSYLRKAGEPQSGAVGCSRLFLGVSLFLSFCIPMIAFFYNGKSSELTSALIGPVFVLSTIGSFFFPLWRPSRCKKTSLHRKGIGKKALGSECQEKVNSESKGSVR
jgi:hypothetical protein